MTTWDASNKDVSITLGRGNTVAAKTASGGSWRSVKATTSKSTGKFYLEYYVNAYILNTSQWIAGFGNSGASTANYIGSSTGSFGIQFQNGTGAIIIYNNTAIATYWTITAAYGFVVGMAIDLDNKLVWIKTDRNTTWNNNGAADPATGTGGLTYATTGALFPMFSAQDAAQQNVCTLNAGSSAFSMAAPSGFSAWDTSAVSPNGQVGTTPTTWNPSDKDSHVALSGGNLVATQSTNSGVYDNVRSTTSHGSGKKYFEVAITTLGTGNNKRGWIAGLANSTASLSNYPGNDNNAVGFQMGDLNDVLFGGNNAGTFNGSQTQGDVYGFAVDMDKGLIWAKNITTNSNWNANASGDPAAGVYGFGLPSTADLFAIWSGADASGTADAATANFGATAFAGTIPTGFTAWDIAAGGGVGSGAVSIING